MEEGGDVSGLVRRGTPESQPSSELDEKERNEGREPCEKGNSPLLSTFPYFGSKTYYRKGTNNGETDSIWVTPTSDYHPQGPTKEEPHVYTQDISGKSQSLPKEGSKTGLRDCTL